MPFFRFASSLNNRDVGSNCLLILNASENLCSCPEPPIFVFSGNARETHSHGGDGHVRAGYVLQYAHDHVRAAPRSAHVHENVDVRAHGNDYASVRARAFGHRARVRGYVNGRVRANVCVHVRVRLP